MVRLMVERIFLGWNRPFVHLAADWLLEQRDLLPNSLVLVPTSQGGRRLRETMVEKAGALLAPRIATPGSLLRSDHSHIAVPWMERVAWQEVLENLNDWSPYAGAFPEPPTGTGAWAGGLAGELVHLRYSLQENGLALADAARMLSNTVEEERWQALAALERLVENKLASWSLKSRTSFLSHNFSLLTSSNRIVLAGVTEMPPLIERALLAWPGPVQILIGAPESESDHFSAVGKPLRSWNNRPMPWPTHASGSVRLVVDPRQAAAEAYQAISAAGSRSDEVALGSADVETGDELTRVLTRSGWSAFHPSSPPLITGLRRWIKLWATWLADPLLSIASDLLALPETSLFVKGRRAAMAEQLGVLRNEWMVLRPADLRHRILTADFRSESHRNSALEVLQTIDTLEKWRHDSLQCDPAEALDTLLQIIAPLSSEHLEQASTIHDWLTTASNFTNRVKRDVIYWIKLLLEEVPAPAPQPPDDRVIDVQGWLELYLEPGSHLILCGMNEGLVPSRSHNDPWLSSNAKSRLGLTSDADRAARDAFLYQSMVAARRSTGRVDVICAKTGAGGEPLLPSRILLAAEPADLPRRVKFLFRDLDPPDANMRWQADWLWRAREKPIGSRLSATSLQSYLTCPFRFYLQFGLRLRSNEPNRVEWNARDFGNIAHQILERWGRDPKARELSKTETLEAWFSAELDRLLAEHFPSTPPLAIRIQAEILRQRLGWAARVQACSRAEGWEIIEVEHDFQLKFGNTTISAKIDRIDRHRVTGEMRVIDYKTGIVDAVDKAHRRKITARTSLPAHLPADCPVIHSALDRGKPCDHRWTNLQLPLYALAIERRDGVLPIPCYFTLGTTESDVALNPWVDFSHADLEAARACTHWIVQRITEGVFWPPAGKVAFDDFAALSAGRPLREVFHELAPIPWVAAEPEVAQTQPAG